MHKTIKKKYPSVVMPRVTVSRLGNNEIVSSIDHKYIIKSIVGNEPIVSIITVGAIPNKGDELKW